MMKAAEGGLPPTKEEMTKMQWEEAQRKDKFVPLAEKLQNEANLKKLVNEGRVSPDVLPGQDQVSTQPEQMPAQAPEQVSFAPTEQPQRAPADLAQGEIAPPQVSTAGLQDAYKQESQGIAQGQAAYEKSLAEGKQKLEALDKQNAAELQAKTQADEQMKRIQELQKEQSALKPEARSFFYGKSTFQKVMAGIGLALASITPQGAQNALKIINSEIDRDLDMQKNAYETKGKEIEEAKGNYSAYMAQLKDANIARQAAKADMIQRLRMDLDAQAQKTSSEVSRAKLVQMGQMAQLEEDKIRATMYQQIQKQKKEEAQGKVPGYEGTIQDPTSARDFRKAVTSTKTAMGEINNLISINKKGLASSFSTKDRASAEQSQTLLRGQLREILVGPGAVSESEGKLLNEAIANPTSFFSLKASNAIRLNKLKSAINNKLKADAEAYGLKKIEVGTLK